MRFTCLLISFFFILISFSALTSNAQEVESEMFWFKSSGLNPNDEGKIDNWLSSDESISATQTDPIKQPSYNADILSGVPGMDLDGFQFLDLPSEINFVGGNRTIFAFYRPDEKAYSILARGSAFASSGYQDGDFGIIPFQTNFRVRWREFDDPIDLVAPNLIQGSFYFIRIQIDRDAGLASLFINEELKNSVACSQTYTGNNTTRSTQIGTFMSNATYMLNGSISDVGMYSFAEDQYKLDKILVDLGSRYLPNIDLGEDVVLSPGESCSMDLSIPSVYDSYLWSTGATTSAITVSEPGEYYVVATGDYGFKVSDTITIGFDENLINGDYLLCSYDSLEWDLGLAPGYTYSWSDGLETTESSRVLMPGNSYSVEISNGSCTTNTPVVSITSDSYSETVEIIEVPIFCLGNELYLASGFAAAESYTWSTGAETAFISPFESGEYTVEATNVNGCVGRDTVEIDIVGTAPFVEFTTGVACEDNAVVFTDVTDPAGSTITEQNWILGSLGFTQGPVTEGVFQESGFYAIELSVSLANGCSGTGRDTVQVYPLPLVGFNHDVVIPCAGNEVAFESQSGVPDNGSIASYAWSFGNGATDTGQVGTTTFDIMGVNTVQLAVTTTRGCIDSLLAEVVVLGSPIVDFSFDTVCVSTSTVFNEMVDISESGSVFYSWKFGDGFFSNFPNTSHTYSAPGVYTVQLTATGNDFGAAGCTHTLSKEVRVFGTPTGAVSTTGACLGEGVVFTDLTSPSVQGGVADYISNRAWVLPYGIGQGPITAGGDSVQVWMAPEDGEYAVRLDFTTDAGCTGSATSNVGVLAIPKAEFLLTLPEIAPPFVVVPENTSIDAQGYVWVMNGEVVSTDAEPELAFADTGVYEVSLVATNSLGCNDTTALSFYVIYPDYDLAILDIRYTHSGNKLALRALLANNGNTTLQGFDMKVNLGLSAAMDQFMDFELLPGDVVEFTLPQEFEYLTSRDLPYVCISVGLRSFGIIEVEVGNNDFCISLDKEKATFIDPYPNPVGGVVKLGFVLPVAGDVEVEILDSSGKLVAGFILSLLGGYSLFDYDVSGFSEGIYLFRYRFGGESETRRVVVGF